MSKEQSRREFIKLISAGSMSIFTLSALGGCETLLQAIQNRPVRRNITGLSPTGSVITTFKDAVNTMKSLPSSDPRNWTEQARIHFDHCPHGNWYFLPWHRAYLYHFEQICRELTGNEDFALPYWNWTQDKQIPSVFWGGSSNPLFNSTRNATSSSSASNSFVGLSVVENIQNETNFLVYASGQATSQRQPSTYGRLEQTPHNYIHGFVGGEMGSFMSPLDAIFWTHHNMIDCLWADWNMNRNNPNTNNTQWTQFDFSGNFVNGQGNPVTTNVLQTVLMPLLSYRFENCIGDPTVEEIDTEAMRTFLREGAKVELDYIDRVRIQRRVNIVVGQPLALNLNLDRSSFKRVLNQENGEKLLLSVGDVDLPQGNDFFVRVFIDKSDANANTSLRDPHYAGSFAFFVDPEVELQHEEKPDYHVDITDTLYRLFREGELGENDLAEVSVNLVAVPFPDRDIRAREFGLNFLEMGIVRPLKEIREEDGE